MRHPSCVSLQKVFFLIGGVAFLDQITKLMILGYFKGPLAMVRLPFSFLSFEIPQTQPLSLLPILDFVLVWNRGISWGLFNQQGMYTSFIFGLLSCLICGYMMFLVWRADRPIVAQCLSIIIGGALGNVIDRILHGAVVDFIFFHWKGYHFPAFNIADAAITLGACSLIMDEILKTHKNDQATKSSLSSFSLKHKNKE